MSELAKELTNRLVNLYNMGQLTPSDIELAVEEAEQRGFTNGQVREFKKRKPDLIELAARRAKGRATGAEKSIASNSETKRIEPKRARTSTFDLEREAERLESERLKKARREAIAKELAADRAKATEDEPRERPPRRAERSVPATDMEGFALPIVEESPVQNSWKTAVARANRVNGFDNEPERPKKLDDKTIDLLVEQQMEGRL